MLWPVTLANPASALGASEAEAITTCSGLAMSHAVVAETVTVMQF